MFYQVIAFLWLFLLDLALVSRMAASQKDLEIVLLRQQLAIVERRQKRVWGSISRSARRIEEFISDRCRDPRLTE